MMQRIGRRELMGAAGAAVVATAWGGTALAQNAPAKRKIVAINGSPRKGMTTSAGLSLCLEAARNGFPEFETELIELADYAIPAQLAAGQPLRPGEVDDFPKLAEKLSDPAVVGIIVGSPVYFGTMSALCKAFLDRCMVFRKGFVWHNRVAGALAVGSARNGGQELTVESIKVALSGQDVLLVGTGQPTVRVGATLWNQGDSIADDAFGCETAKDLGRRVAEVARKVA